MSTLKTLLLATIALGLSFSTAIAATNVTPAQINGQVVYKQTFTLAANTTEDEAYAMVKGWFMQSPAKFNHANTANSDMNQSARNRAEVESQFQNAQPLQSLDPEAKRLVGRGMIKYFGGANSGINMLYMEYYIIVEITGHQLTVTINNLRYHHFNRSFNEKPIYNFAGGQPYDSADKYENIIQDQSTNTDVKNLSAFLNSDMAKLLNDLSSHLKTKSTVASN